MAKKRRVVARAQEPSTWAGIAGIFLAAGQAFAQTGSKTTAILTALAAIAGGAAAVMPEKAKPEEPTQ